MATATVPAYPVRQKTPDEVKSITFNFSDELAPGTTLQGSPTVVAETGLTVVGSAAIDGTGTLVTAQVSGGVMGNWYIVDCRCGASDGQTHTISAVVEIAPVN